VQLPLLEDMLQLGSGSVKDGILIDVTVKVKELVYVVTRIVVLPWVYLSLRV